MSKYGNLPPGVTGREDVFGPQYIRRLNMICNKCDRESVVEVEVYNQHYEFTCPHCDQWHRDYREFIDF